MVSILRPNLLLFRLLMPTSSFALFVLLWCVDEYSFKTIILLITFLVFVFYIVSYRNIPLNTKSPNPRPKNFLFCFSERASKNLFFFHLSSELLWLFFFFFTFCSSFFYIIITFSPLNTGFDSMISVI